MTDAALPDLDARPKGRFLKKILMWLLFALLLGGGGFGAGFYVSGGRLSPSQEVLRLIELETAIADADTETGPKRIPREKSETTAFETRYHEFPDPLTTNLKGSRRFLQIGVGVSTQYDESVIAHVETHAMALRSDMLAVISGFSEEDVEGTAGREALADALKTAINTRLETLEGFGGIESVFFPSFVLQ
ncbi:flagellar basal body-associated FliL family protein [Roseovarius sp.]|uniref:flagellar basal body-associated FliL family protein n=1 Tax=Roseovarius sp. TaxID=1486281 RepID=UPI003A988473